ncbi:hypothetical protein D3C77_736640 [compost metagenome]
MAEKMTASDFELAWVLNPNRRENLGDHPLTGRRNDSKTLVRLVLVEGVAITEVAYRYSLRGCTVSRLKECVSEVRNQILVRVG